MLALHYIIIFSMLYLMMFHLLEIPKKRKSWHLNIVLIAIFLVAELVLGGYGIYHDFRPPIYELIYTVFATLMILYMTQRFKMIPLVFVLNVFLIVMGLSSERK